MGSWNETCGLSNLPIRCGDDDAVFVIMGKAVGDGVYSTSFYKPISLPIFGEYADYGGIDNITNPEIAQILYDNMVAMRENDLQDGNYKLYVSGIDDRTKEDEEDGEDDLYKYDSEKRFQNVEDMLNCIERGYLYIKWAYYDETHYVTQMMVHRSVYDAVISEWGSRIGYEDTVCLRDRYRELFIKEKTTRQESINDIQSSDEDDKIKALLMAHLTIKDGYSRIIRMFEGYEGSRNGLTYVCKQYLNSENDTLLEPLLDMLMIRGAFEAGRIAWRQCVGKGAQQEEYMIHKVIWDTAYALVVAQHKEMIDEDGELMEADGEDTSLAEYMRETVWNPRG